MFNKYIKEFLGLGKDAIVFCNNNFHKLQTKYFEYKYPTKKYKHDTEFERELPTLTDEEFQTYQQHIKNWVLMNPKMPWGDYEYYDRLVKSVLEQAKIYDKNHLTYSLTTDQRAKVSYYLSEAENKKEEKASMLKILKDVYENTSTTEIVKRVLAKISNSELNNSQTIEKYITDIIENKIYVELLNKHHKNDIGCAYLSSCIPTLENFYSEQISDIKKLIIKSKIHFSNISPSLTDINKNTIEIINSYWKWNGNDESITEIQRNKKIADFIVEQKITDSTDKYNTNVAIELALDEFLKSKNNLKEFIQEIKLYVQNNQNKELKALQEEISLLVTSESANNDIHKIEGVSSEAKATAEHAPEKIIDDFIVLEDDACDISFDINDNIGYVETAQYDNGILGFSLKAC